MLRLLLASRNAHKTREFAELLAESLSLRDLTSEPDSPTIVETGSTFQENAAIKALAISKWFRDEIVIADDSGLEVDALDGAPGIISARYAGEKASDRQNVEKLLRELRSLAPSEKASERSKWTARFRCVIAVAKDGELFATFEGEVGGHIIDFPRGENGFGYDPIFVPAGSTETFAELPSTVKNQISHRARAAAKLREFLGNRS